MAQPIRHLGWRQGQGTAPRRSGAARVFSLQISHTARLLYAIVGLYALTFAALSILQHNSFQTNAFDLGNMDQAVWNTAHGEWFRFTNYSGLTTRLGIHIEPILLPISLLYRIYADPRVLLVFQAIVISLGALPAFWLARSALGHDFAGIAFAAAYLLAPTLESANLADFHPVALSSATLLYAFYYLYRGDYPWFLLFAVASMATKEQVPLPVALMGLYILFIQKERRWGVATIAISLTWFVVSFAVLLPRYSVSGISPYFSRYDYLGSGPGEILANVVSHPGDVWGLVTAPDRIQYLQRLLGPLVFLPLFSPATLVTALPDIGINVLSTFPPMRSFSAHYGSVTAPLLIISGILGAARIAGWARRLSPHLATATVFMLSAAVLVSSLLSYRSIVFLPLSDHLPSVTAHHRRGEEILRQIPPEAVVSAGTTLNPHLSGRRSVYLFPDVYDADYIVLDVSANPYPKDDASLWWEVQQLLDSGDWGIASAYDGYLLLKRGLRLREPPEPFYSFTRTRTPRIPSPTDLTFGGRVRLLGYAITPTGPLHGDDPYARLTLYWQTLRPLGEDYGILVTVATPDGRTVFMQRFFAATLWYPTSRWKPEDVSVVDMPRVPLGMQRTVQVNVGIFRGQEPSDASARLPVAFGAKGDGPARSSDGTLALLTTLEREAP